MMKDPHAELLSALAQLRHMYGHMVNGRVGGVKELATGLLGPQIKKLEAIAAAVETLQDDLEYYRSSAPNDR